MDIIQNLIYQTQNFTLEIHPQPFVSRADGGHLRIFPKDKARISDRRDFSSLEAIEFIRLSMIAGQALETVMNKQGIPVVKINYEELGNWAFKRGEKPILHLHIFGRAKNATKQIFPEAVQLPDRSTGFYDGFEPLNKKDILLIKNEVERLYQTDKYQDSNWTLG